MFFWFYLKRGLWLFWLSFFCFSAPAGPCKKAVLKTSGKIGGGAGSAAIQPAGKPLAEDNFAGAKNLSDNQWEREIHDGYYRYLPQSKNSLSIFGKTGFPKGANALSSFLGSEFNKYRDAAHFYAGYIGRDASVNILRQSPEIFVYEGPLDYLQQGVEFLNDYMGREAVTKLMEKKLESFSHLKLNAIRPVINFLDSRLGAERANETLKSNFETALRSARIKELEPIVRLLDSRIGRPSANEVLITSFRAVSMAKIKKIKPVLRFLYHRLGAKLADKILRENFESVSRAKLEELKPAVELFDLFLDERAGNRILRHKLQIAFQSSLGNWESVAVFLANRLYPDLAEGLKNKLEALPIVEPIELKLVLEFLDNRLGQQTANKILKKHFFDVLDVSLNQLKSVTGALDRHLEKEAVNTALKNSFHSLFHTPLRDLPSSFGHFSQKTVIHK